MSKITQTVSSVSYDNRVLAIATTRTPTPRVVAMTDPSWICGFAPTLKDHKHRVNEALPVMLEALLLCHSADLTTIGGDPLSEDFITSLRTKWTRTDLQMHTKKRTPKSNAQLDTKKRGLVHGVLYEDVIDTFVEDGLLSRSRGTYKHKTRGVVPRVYLTLNGYIPISFESARI